MFDAPRLRSSLRSEAGGAVHGASSGSERTVPHSNRAVIQAVRASLGPEPGTVRVPATGGRPIPDAVRGPMEQALGADFSSVRVHEGSTAPRLGAVAFTQGESLHFAPGRYRPASSEGRHLIGHELAHVVQQRAGRVRSTGSVRGVALNDDASLEAEADRMGARAARASASPEPGIQRVPMPSGPAPVQRAVAVIQRWGDLGSDEDIDSEIYGIWDMNAGTIIYVGQARNSGTRFTQHVNQDAAYPWYKMNWSQHPLPYQYEVLEKLKECTELEITAAEEWWWEKKGGLEGALVNKNQPLKKATFNRYKSTDTWRDDGKRIGLGGQNWSPKK